jgi:hypothetical protein
MAAPVQKRGSLSAQPATGGLKFVNAMARPRAARAEATSPLRCTMKWDTSEQLTSVDRCRDDPETPITATEQSGTGLEMFRTLNLGFRTPRLEFQTLSLGFQTPGLGSQTLILGFRTPPLGFRTPPLGFRTPPERFRTLPERFRTLPERFRTLPERFRTLNTETPITRRGPGSKFQ